IMQSSGVEFMRDEFAVKLIDGIQRHIANGTWEAVQALCDNSYLVSYLPKERLVEIAASGRVILHGTISYVNQEQGFAFIQPVGADKKTRVFLPRSIFRGTFDTL